MPLSAVGPGLTSDCHWLGQQADRLLVSARHPAVVQGFDSYCLRKMGRNPEIQEQLRFVGLEGARNSETLVVPVVAWACLL